MTEKDQEIFSSETLAEILKNKDLSFEERVRAATATINFSDDSDQIAQAY